MSETPRNTPASGKDKTETTPPITKEELDGKTVARVESHAQRKRAEAASRQQDEKALEKIVDKMGTGKSQAQKWNEWLDEYEEKVKNQSGRSVAQEQKRPSAWERIFGRRNTSRPLEKREVSPMKAPGRTETTIAGRMWAFVELLRSGRAVQDAHEVRKSKK